jgi:hypothetical protein
VTQDPFRNEQPQSLEQSLGATPTYYALLDLPLTATLEQIRRAYRLKSKLYHPDTTILPPEIAVQKFRDLNTAYDTLSNAERRAGYDKCSERRPFGVSISDNEPSVPRSPKSRTASVWPLDPTERPLSGGELFALFLLGITFLVCLAIAIILGIARGEMVLQSSTANSSLGVPALVSHPSPRPSVAKIYPRSGLPLGKSVELKKERLSARPKPLKTQPTKRSAS